MNKGADVKSYEKFADPAVIGPGLWFLIHTMAIKAVTEDLKRAFVVNINGLCDSMKCQKCKGHFRKFIDTYDLRKYWSIRDGKGRDIGLFKWTWELHNQVNKMLNKPQPSLDSAYAFYNDNNAGICVECGNKPSTGSVIVKVRERAKPMGFDVTNDDMRTMAIPPILDMYRNNQINTRPFLRDD